jgi:hypothetical protein
LPSGKTVAVYVRFRAGAGNSDAHEAEAVNVAAYARPAVLELTTAKFTAFDLG